MQCSRPCNHVLVVVLFLSYDYHSASTPPANERDPVAGLAHVRKPIVDSFTICSTRALPRCVKNKLFLTSKS
ncbi:hypothetical protein F5B22DRAFT_622493 [Xylaria bambusicola]|uniref:uncharacterized protein n=1 Tax=Xylaria bambusicola TaxID=326684 RepID=UPI0020086AF4|nr:uncharacterized protein F5B22DRAFT_622493 [Xylaria bambusicola]KAI0506740.1 hypothetical protein F5B22DRAFT_622493 [Xylaria bambusicola]